MSVNQYIDQKTGESLWRVYVSVRSKEDPKIREQKHVLGLKTKKAALDEEKKLLKELSKNVTIKASQGSTWGSIIEQWETAVRSDPIRFPYAEDTIEDYVNKLKNWTHTWLNRVASDLNKGDGREVLRTAEVAGKSFSFQKNLKNTINVVFNWGIETRLIKGVHESPTKGLPLSRKLKEKPPEILNLDEIKTLLSEAQNLNHPWYPIWAVALLTGMRNGELHALLWTDIDIKNRSITVSKSFNTRKKIVKSTKSGLWRTVPISDDLLILLKKIKKSTGNTPCVLPRFWKWDQGLQASVLRAFCISLGVKSIRFHALRACFATQLLAHDIAPARIMKVCGWQDLSTMQRYIRLAGVEEKGVTQPLRILPTNKALMEEASNVFKLKS